MKEFIKIATGIAAPMVVVVVSILFTAMVFHGCESDMAEDPPLWWQVRQKRARELAESPEPTLQVVFMASDLTGIALPKGIKTTVVDKGLIIEGPRDSVVRLYRNVHGLDQERKTIIWGFAWRKDF